MVHAVIIASFLLCATSLARRGHQGQAAAGADGAQTAAEADRLAAEAAAEAARLAAEAKTRPKKTTR